MKYNYKFALSWQWGIGKFKPFGSLNNIYEYFIVIGYLQLRKLKPT